MALSARDKILRAAFKEFARRGFAGTRVEAIARQARVNKQLLYYYFGNKRGLYEAVASSIHAEREAAIEGSPDELADNLAYWLRQHAGDLDYLRLLMWESLEVSAKSLPGEASRQHFWRESRQRVVRDQQAGLWPVVGPDPAHALLTLLGVVMFPLAFPQLTKLISGRSATDERFLRDREAHLRELARLLTDQLAPSAPASR